MKKKSKVKGHVRNGKFVRSFVRTVEKKEKRNKKLKNLAVGAVVLGMPVATFGALKLRYLNNLNKFAQNLKPNAAIGKVVKPGKQHITFAIGGFNVPKFKESGFGGSTEYTGLSLKKALPPSVRKKVEVINLPHKLNKSISLDEKDPRNKVGSHIAENINLLTKNLVKGSNPETLRLAETAYNYALKNPGKNINLVGYSVGGNMARDINYILKKKGIKAKVISLAASDARIHSFDKNTMLNIYSPHDLMIGITKPRKAYVPKNFPKVDPGNAHRLENYTANPDVLDRINKFLYPDLF